MRINPKIKLIPALAAALALLLSGCAGRIGAEQTAAPAETPATPAEAVQAEYGSGAGKAAISEIMAKNKATLRDGNGSFSDWVEIENLSGADLDMTGWSLSDRDGGSGWTFPEYTLKAGEMTVVFCSGNDSSEGGELHTDFSVSAGERLTLRDRNGDEVSAAEIGETAEDFSLIPGADGAFTVTKYPTPGEENTAAAYEALQERNKPAGPLVINEACVHNTAYQYIEKLGFPDWAEIKNISGETLSLEGWSLSDNIKKPGLFSFTGGQLAPGESTVVLLDKNAELYYGEMNIAPFSLGSDSDRLYLCDGSGKLVDFMPLTDIPYGGSCGRMDGRGGFFRFASPSPGEDNTDGLRRVSAAPAALTPDGVFDGVKSVRAELSAPGKIWYTTDGTVPAPQVSEKYTGPLNIDKTCILRAVSAEEGALVSRPLTLSFIINEGHELPVVSLVSNDKDTFNTMFLNGYKLGETPSSVSYYGADGSWTMGCGIKMHGDTSLVLNKKNMSVKFRGCYGDGEFLSFDLFGGGVCEFSNLLLRAGQDQNNTIVRNEAVQNLAMKFSDSVIAQRSKYAALYVDGNYNGIYALMEKTNEQLYASIAGVSRDSVRMTEATVYENDPFFLEALNPIFGSDMSVGENYLEAAKHLDMDSIIDWTLIEGWAGNFDLAEGNLRYCSSTENGGQWKLMLYDLDCAFSGPTYCMDNVLNYPNQISRINTDLLKSPIYRQRMLERASLAYGSFLTDENIIAEFERLGAEISSELERDGSVSSLGSDSWRRNTDQFEEMIKQNNWTEMCIDRLCVKLDVTEEERAQYFG